MADTSKKKPPHTAYAVRNFQKDSGEEDTNWTKLGVVWVHRDGKGFDIVFDALPANGRTVLRLNKAKPARAGE